jgi:hypothetical protein
VFQDTEMRLGRSLSDFERHVDQLAIVQQLEAKKAELHDEIEAEKRRAIFRYLRHGRPYLEVTPRMRRILLDLYDFGKQQAIELIQARGLPVRTHAARDEPGLDLTIARLGDRLGGIGLRIGRETPDALGRSDTERELRRIIDRRVPGTLDAASRVVSGALAAGQGDIFSLNSPIFTSWVYSAMMDARTCAVCQRLDGTTYPTWQAIQAVLPDGGPNPSCYGDGRCRCMAVPEEAAPELPLPEPPAETPFGPSERPRTSLTPEDAARLRALVPEPPTPAPVTPAPAGEIAPVVQSLEPNRDAFFGTLEAIPRELEKGAAFAEVSANEWEYMLKREMAAQLDEAELSVHAPVEAALKIVKDGRFKTQFETKSSRGLLNTRVRAMAEGNMFGYPDNLPPAERPVYGAFTSHRLPGDDVSDFYGRVQFVLSDEARTRATFTGHDSLNTGLIPSSPFAPNVESTTLQALSGDLQDVLSTGSYVEAQIHGGVSLADVDEVRIKAFDAGSGGIYDQLIMALEKRGIPVELV